MTRVLYSHTYIHKYIQINMFLCIDSSFWNEILVSIEGICELHGKQQDSHLHCHSVLKVKACS